MEMQPASVTEADVRDLLAEVRRLRERNQELAAQALLQLMSDISEEFWCAGWMSELEHSLWTAINDDETRRAWRFPSVDAYAETLLKLAGEAGGWWRSNEEYEQVFVPTEQWLTLHRAWREKRKP